MVDEVRLEDDWVPLDEQLGPAQLEEAIRAKEAHSSAIVLESVSKSEMFFSCCCIQMFSSSSSQRILFCLIYITDWGYS